MLFIHSLDIRIMFDLQLLFFISHGEFPELLKNKFFYVYWCESRASFKPELLAIAAGRALQAVLYEYTESSHCVKITRVPRLRFTCDVGRVNNCMYHYELILHFSESWNSYCYVFQPSAGMSILTDYFIQRIMIINQREDKDILLKCLHPWYYDESADIPLLKSFHIFVYST